MKIINYLLFITALGFFMASCSDNDDPVIVVEEGEPATLSITLANSSPGIKTIGDATQAQENTINNFTVYVFNSTSNILEKSETFTTYPALTQTITGLVTGTKKVVVVANTPTGYTLGGTNYGALATAMFNLSTQADSDNLAMSGESTTTLSATPASNTLSIPLSRIVAKIKLGEIKIEPEQGHTGTFTVDSVYIMKARSTASIGVPTVTTGNGFFGGIIGTISETPQSFLRDAVVSDGLGGYEANNHYFYVFPNDDTNSNATLITIAGTYDGVRMYYPFRINDDTNTGTANDNKYIKRNQLHTINVTIKRPGNGGPDPEIPVDPATLDITVYPEDWILMPQQNVEW